MDSTHAHPQDTEGTAVEPIHRQSPETRRPPTESRGRGVPQDEPDARSALTPDDTGRDDSTHAHPHNTPGVDLDAMQARADAATPGPWWGQSTEVWADRNVPPHRCVAFLHPIGDDLDEHHEPDAEFIAHAREDVPALVGEVRRLRSILDGEA